MQRNFMFNMSLEKLGTWLAAAYLLLIGISKSFSIQLLKNGLQIKGLNWPIIT
jgi:hypothetical protein